MPLDINTISMSLPASDPSINVGSTFTLRIAATETGSGFPEIATLTPEFSTDDISFSSIGASGDLSASPTSRNWSGVGNYDFTITGNTPGTYYVRGHSSGENSGTKDTASQQSTISRRIFIT